VYLVSSASGLVALFVGINGIVRVGYTAIAFLGYWFVLTVLYMQVLLPEGLSGSSILLMVLYIWVLISDTWLGC
jgi:hypothetical protein